MNHKHFDGGVYLRIQEMRLMLIRDLLDELSSLRSVRGDNMSI